MSSNSMEKGDLYMTTPPSAAPLMGEGPSASLPSSTPRVLTNAAEALSPEALVGMMVGHFRLLDVIGYGGFGVVYLVEHEHLRERFALKLVRAMQKSDPSILKRFQREANTLARLNHTNIVSLKDFGEIGEAGLYYVMEYLQGKDLKETIINEYPLSAYRIKNIVGQVCDALYYMHEKTIFHRDMKPGNVILVSQPRHEPPELVKLIDFGIASTVTEDTDLTQTGMLMGSMPYISPEQARGDSSQIDARSDLYSLAIMVYQMLTQHLPFQSSHIPGMITHHLFTPPPSLGLYRPEHKWSPDLDQFIAKALAKNPEERYPDAMVFWREFEQALATQPSLLQLSNESGSFDTIGSESAEEVMLVPIDEEEEDVTPPTIVNGMATDPLPLSQEAPPEVQDNDMDYLGGLLPLDEFDDDEGPTRVVATSLLSSQDEQPNDTHVPGSAFFPLGPSEQSVVRPFVFQETEPTAHEGKKLQENRSKWIKEIALFLVCMIAGGGLAYRLLFVGGPKVTPPPPREGLPSLRLPALRPATPTPPQRRPQAGTSTSSWAWRVLSEPKGAMVYRDGAYVGKTPFNMTGAPGSSTVLTFQTKGYTPHQETFVFITTNALKTVKMKRVGEVAKRPTPRAPSPRRTRALVRRARPSKRRPSKRRPPVRRKKIYDVDDPF